MRFSDICLVTHNVPRLVAFYETLFGVKAEGDAIHSVLPLPGVGLAIYNREAGENDMGFDFTGAGCGLVSINFNCDSAQNEYARIQALGFSCLSAPLARPWGATSFFLHDPDGNLIGIRSYRKEG